MSTLSEYKPYKLVLQKEAPTTTDFTNIAILSDVSAAFGGAESILVTALELYPEADFFTPVFKENVIPEKYLNHRKITTSFLQKLPYPEKLYKAYLPLMPLAIELLNIQNYDLIFSSHRISVIVTLQHDISGINFGHIALSMD
jgi:hypothetical protein